MLACECAMCYVHNSVFTEIGLVLYEDESEFSILTINENI